MYPEAKPPRGVLEALEAVVRVLPQLRPSNLYTFKVLILLSIVVDSPGSSEWIEHQTSQRKLGRTSGAGGRESDLCIGRPVGFKSHPGRIFNE